MDYKELINFYQNKSLDKFIEIVKYNSIKNNNFLLIDAVKDQNIDLVKILIKYSDPKSYNSQALYDAILSQNVELINLLIPLSHKENLNSITLNIACNLNNTEVFKTLLNHAQPDINCLVSCSVNGNLELAKIIIKYVDPSINNCEALKTAIKHEKEELIKFLIPLSNIDNLINSLNQDYEKHIISIIEKYKDIMLKNTLNEILEDDVNSSKGKGKGKGKRKM